MLLKLVLIGAVLVAAAIAQAKDVCVLGSRSVGIHDPYFHGTFLAGSEQYFVVSCTVAIDSFETKLNELSFTVQQGCNPTPKNCYGLSAVTSKDLISSDLAKAQAISELYKKGYGMVDSTVLVK